MKARRDKILDVAVALAEEGGFDNVRQRDVAARAGVALGTLYKSFRSKEDILTAALEREAEMLERRMEAKPATGATAIERVGTFFNIVTRGLCRKPKYARAVLRAMASGEPEVAAKVAAYQERITGLIIAAIRGMGRLSYADAKAAPPSKKEASMAFALQQYWFASLVGWSAGMNSINDVVDQMRRIALVLDRGIDHERPERSR
ncbi:MAG TPA: TetR family transcriptional regulator [Polyangiaceae bacterium]|jgi:AcrR family transcriptional regulator